jgi:hypothetical protein
MKNREWLNTLSNKELINYLIASCDICANAGKDCTEHNAMNCFEGCEKWLEQEHEGEVSHEEP